MSCYEWERGTIKLPSSAAVRLKGLVRDLSNQLHTRVLELSQQWWDKNQTRSTRLFNQRLSQTQNRVWDGTGYRGHDLMEELAQNLMLEVLQDLTYRLGPNGQGMRVAPHKPRHADVDRVAPRANVRTTSFRLGEATVTFDGANMTWAVAENNHAVDVAHQHPIVGALFSELRRVAWTRGTGGVIVGNNEYNRDNREAGGGANYVTAQFGPLGAKAGSL